MASGSVLKTSVLGEPGIDYLQIIPVKRLVRVGLKSTNCRNRHIDGVMRQNLNMHHQIAQQ